MSFITMLSTVQRRPLLNWAAGGIAMTADGNSLTELTPRWTLKIVTRAPLTTAGITTVTNLGIGGQTTTDMLTNRTDVANAYVWGKNNILIAWEFYNAILKNAALTPQGAVDELMNYCTLVKADRPWRIAVATAVPGKYWYSTVQADTDAHNAKLDQANALLRQQYRRAADHLIELRVAGSPFNLANYNFATFTASGLYSGDNVHFTDAGSVAVADLMAAGLAKMPR